MFYCLLLIFFIFNFVFEFSESKVIELVDANFNDFTQSDGDLWIVQFHAPWCGHCKKLAPIFEELSEKVPESVRVAKFDATLSRVITKEHEIKKFPTIKYYRNGYWGKYEGHRNLKELLELTERLLKPITEEIKSESVLSSIPVSFLLKIPSGDIVSSTGERKRPDYKKITTNFENAVISLHATALMFRMPSYEVDSVTLCRMHYANVSSKCLVLSSKSTVEVIENFITLNNRALVTKFDNSNFKKLGSLGLVMMIGVVDYSKTEQSYLLIEKISKVAESSNPEILDKIIFGHVDGVKWRKFLSHYNTKTNMILILNLESDTYRVYNSDISLEELYKLSYEISQDSLELIKAKQKGFLEKITNKLNDYYPWSLLCLIPFVLIICSYSINVPKKIKSA